MAAVSEGLNLLAWRVVMSAKNKVGLTRDQAKDLFYRFRGGGTKGNEEDPQSDSTAGSAEMATVIDHMRTTNERLNKIEEDLDYLKCQVDRILEKI